MHEEVIQVHTVVPGIQEPISVAQIGHEILARDAMWYYNLIIVFRGHYAVLPNVTTIF